MSRTLRSLWEIMLPVNPLLFVYLSSTNQLEQDIAKHATEAGFLGGLIAKALGAGGHPKDKIPLSERTDSARFYKVLEKAFREIGLTTSAITLGKIIEALSKDKCKYKEFYELFSELDGRLRDELLAIEFLALNLKEADWYKNPRRGWDEVIERFPGTVRDIEELTKCFALGRYAASVFHSLQVVEIGLIDLGKLLQVNDPQPGWTSTANALGLLQKKKYQDKTQFEQKNSAFFEQMNACVESLKNAWRNKVSHAGAKLFLLNPDFTPEISEEIIYATRAFMRRLATDLPASSEEVQRT